MTYNIWGIQAITGQGQNQPPPPKEAKAPPQRFISALYAHAAECAVPTAAPGGPATLHAFVFPHLREVNHVDLNSFSSKKKVHRYIA